MLQPDYLLEKVSSIRSIRDWVVSKTDLDTMAVDRQILP
jgi:hypothetical protein